MPNSTVFPSRMALLLWTACVLLPLSAPAAVPGDTPAVTGSPAAQEGGPSPAAAISEGRPEAIVAAEPRKLGMEAYDKEDYPKAVEHLSAARRWTPPMWRSRGGLVSRSRRRGPMRRPCAC